MKKIGIVGAGFTGAVIAHELANAGYEVDVFDSRGHVAGNCHSVRDENTDIMLHVYGPHIFHTDNERVWQYVQKFDVFMPFINRVKAIACGRVFSLPINLMTINTLFGKTLSPDEAKAYLADLSDKSIDNPESFEEQALKFVGHEVYKTFFKGYTLKQWGISPANLPASILKRLPVRFNYDDNYYNSKYQGMPLHGYTYIVEKLLNHKNINVILNSKFTRKNAAEFDHVFYSGPLDQWFDYSEGELTYRTLDFVKEEHDGDFQGNAVINYCDESIPWTRISEHKHFSPWETHKKTVIYKEFSRQSTRNDLPYYPVRLSSDKEVLRRYIDIANNCSKITFVGRLATYRYLDMDVTIAEALKAVDIFLSAPEKMPAFIVDPLN